MDTNNTPAAIGNEALATLQTASQVLERNKETLLKVETVGNSLASYIQQNGMSDAIDEKCNQYLVKVREALKNMNDRRSPITQLMTQISKQFTTLENEVKEGKTFLFIQQSRNDWAKKKADAARKAEEEAKRKLAIENEKVDIMQKIASSLIEQNRGHIQTVSNHLIELFNKATLENFDAEMSKIKAFPSELQRTHYDRFQHHYIATYLNLEQVQEIVKEVKETLFNECAKSYWEIIDDLKLNLEGKVEARRKELQIIAENERTNKAEAERLKIEAEARIKAEKEEADRKAKEESERAQNAAKAQAEADKMNNLFNATSEAVTPDQGKAQVRSQLKITVSHQAAWVEIFTHYMQIEGMKLGIDELGKKSLNQMKAACEKHATKTGELIQSKYIKYEEDFTAVNKA